MGKTAFMGGSLNFKGEKKRSKKKSKKSKHKIDTDEEVALTSRRKREESGSKDEVLLEEDGEEMTEAERRAHKRKLERQLEDNRKIAQKSHRERVEALNEHLGSLTELNDIPRVSAAGNG